MTTRKSDMTKYFGFNNGFVKGSVPQNAWAFGLIIQDRNLTGSSFGLRNTHIPFQDLQYGNIPALSKSANYDDSPIPGRFESIMTYTHSNNHEFSISLQYRAEGSELLNHKTKWTIEQIARLSAKLESLTFPQYDRKFSPPNYCLLNIGSIFVDFPIIIKSVNVMHKPPFRTKDLMPYNRDITLECRSYFPTWQAIGARDIINEVTERGVRSSGGIERPRRVYAFRKFRRRQV
jgi:hypothetical protein